MRYPLTLYAMEESVDTFEDVIRADALAAAEMMTHTLQGDFDFDARLFAFEVEPTPPVWADLLAEGFPDFEPTPSAMSKVALVLKLDVDGGPRFFAATFGSGRFLLRRDAYQPGYGLRVALNSIYEGDRPDQPLPSDCLRVVQTTTISKNTMRTLKQANQDAAFQDFGVDLDRDQLGRVVGAPRSERWGRRITGSDAIRVQVVEHLGELGQLCRDLARVRNASDYRARFKAIDDIQTVPDDEIPRLEASVLEVLKVQPDQVRLSPAGLLDWDEIAAFRLSFVSERALETLAVADLLIAIEESGSVLTIDFLKEEYVEAESDEGETLARWSLFETVDVEWEDEGQTYLLVGSRFYAVAEDYLDELHRYLEGIEESEVKLPSSRFWEVQENGKSKTVEENEGDYNARAAKKTGFALLDKKTVRLPRGGDPIEVCDLFSLDRQLIHVKRKFSSSSLSHLFGQGAVSGDLLLWNDEYRHEFADKLEQPAMKALVGPDRPDARSFEIVYAIIGDWKGEGLADRLPFFSKINLRRHVRDLRTLGYRVTYCPVGLQRATGSPPS